MIHWKRGVRTVFEFWERFGNLRGNSLLKLGLNICDCFGWRLARECSCELLIWDVWFGFVWVWSLLILVLGNEDENNVDDSVRDVCTHLPMQYCRNHLLNFEFHSSCVAGKFLIILSLMLLSVSTKEVLLARNRIKQDLTLWGHFDLVIFRVLGLLWDMALMSRE